MIRKIFFIKLLKKLYEKLLQFILVTRGDIVANIINKEKSENYIEIGVYKGDTFLNVLENCPRLRELSGVDSYDAKNYNNYQRDNTEQFNQKTLDEAYYELKYKLKYEPSTKLYKSDSLKASKLIRNNSVDIIFIDASHKYEDVKKDIKIWLPKIKKGGVLIGHDYCIVHFGVILAVNELLGINNTQILPHDIWYYKKK